MTKKIINSSRAPKAIGPYSQAVEDGGFIFTSSVLPIDPVTGEIFSGDVQVQTELILNNLTNILKEAGCTLKNVVKTTVFMTDLTKFAEMNATYATFFSENPPARTTVQVTALPKGSVVQIEAIAKK
jgi:2-iminobutanoate/2-iminopropanoate deaminase